MEVDVDKATETVGKLDKFLTALGVLGRKHWGKMIVLAIMAGASGFFYLVYMEIENEYIDSPVEYYDEYDTTDYDRNPYGNE